VLNARAYAAAWITSDADADRPVHPAGGQRGLPRSAIRQLTERASGMSDAETTPQLRRPDRRRSARPCQPRLAPRLRRDRRRRGRLGLRAAIERGKPARRPRIISKSLFGKAHTVMAEGRLARRHGQRQPQRQLAGHYRDTMRGGKYLNNWRWPSCTPRRPRTGSGSSRPGRGLRPDQGRQDQPAELGGTANPRLAHVGDAPAWR